MYQKIAQIFLYKYNFSVLKSVFINGTAIIFTFTHLNLRQLKSYSVHLQFSLNFEVLFAVKHCAGYTNYQGPIHNSLYSDLYNVRVALTKLIKDLYALTHWSFLH